MDMSLDEIAEKHALKKELDNTIILSNVIELSSSVLAKMVGTNMANVLKNSTVTKSVLASLVAKHVGYMIETNAVTTAAALSQK